MLPDEYKPLVLNPRQQQNHDLITSLGFRISPRPFAGKGEVLYFFAMRADVEYTVDLYFGSVHQTGTHKIWQLSELQAAFGSEQTAEQPPKEKEATHPVVEEAVVPPPAKAETAKPQASAPAVPVSRERPAAIAESGKAIAVASPVKKKQTALF